MTFHPILLSRSLWVPCRCSISPISAVLVTNIAPLQGPVYPCKSSVRTLFQPNPQEIVDGDTIDISTIRVRLVLVNTPESGESGYTEARDFVESVCGVGTKALVDEDDRQREGSFDRLIGVVYCGDSGINNKESLNELLLEGGYGVIDQDFCNISEFSSSSWAKRYGC
jgi:micrococcal nuclease